MSGRDLIVVEESPIMANAKREQFAKLAQLLLTAIIAAGASAATTWLLQDEPRVNRQNDAEPVAPIGAFHGNQPVMSFTATLEDAGTAANVEPLADESPGREDEAVATALMQEEELRNRVESLPLDSSRQRAVSDYFWELEQSRGVREPSALRCAGTLCRAEYHEISPSDRGAVVDAVRASYAGEFMFNREEDGRGAEVLTLYLSETGAPLFEQDDHEI